MQSSNTNSESNNDSKENEHIEDNEEEEKENQEEDEDEENQEDEDNEEEDEVNEENEEDWEDNEDINQEGFIPEFPNFGLDYLPTLSTNPANGIYMQMGNSHILGNLNNLHGLFEIMMSNMIPINNVPGVISNVPGVTSNVPGVTSNVPDATANIITEINPSNSSNSVLANTTLNGQQVIQQVIHPLIHPMSNVVTEQMVVTQQMVEEEVSKLILSGMDNLHLVSEPLLNFIEHCYLENMQYDDDIINLIRYTIKYCFTRRTEFEAKELISGILYYSFNGNNSLFSDNYDDIVLPMLTNELKRIVTQSIRLAILQRAFAAPQMEDVKLVVNPDVLEKIPKSKYIELNDKIKSMNVSCTVCQDEFNEEDMVRILPCEHIYHPDCIDDWLTAHSYKCPCCRKPAAEYSAKI
jgi:hypothetical protein